MSVLAASNLAARLGEKQVLAKVSLRLRSGQVTALVGANGAGKSTFLECLAGLRQPDAGRVELDAQPVLRLSTRARARRIGFLPQSPEIAWAVDVRTYVGLGRTAHTGAWGLRGEDRAAVEAALGLTNLEALSSRSILSLSGGERARALIARVLAGQPEWLLADEPLAGLDPRHVLEAADLFRRMAHDEGQGVLLTLHDLGTAMRVADRIVVLSGGRVIADGAPGEALTPAVLRQAYGVEARVAEGVAGPMVEVLRLAG